jgi:biofilm PGA synthesis lipoprotein PgaB
MRRVSRISLALAWLVLITQVPAAAATGEWVAVSWHDVRDQVAREVDADAFAVSTGDLAAQFEWLQREGWQPVSLQQIIDAREGRATLPPKAVLLSFDDGLASLYTRVFPLLQAFGYPAVVAINTGWLEAVAAGATVPYENRLRAADGFVTWGQLREMVDSGLVEIASHTHDLHRGILGNPQGNQQPAVTTAAWLPQQERYETDAERAQRLRQDLARSIAVITRETGRAPRAIAWPYGEYDALAESVAAQLGLHVSFGLTTGVNRSDRLQGLNRLLITGNPGLERFALNLPQRPTRSIQRVAQVDLDYVFDPDPAQQERNLDALVERMHALEITTVYLQAFADPDGDGLARELYFPNRHLPMRADLFNRVAWQLRTRAGVAVYAWLPVLAFAPPDEELAAALSVRRHLPEGGTAPAGFDHPRLSPFLPEARALVGEIYADLARHAHIAGVLFHDDAFLAADEDAAACLATASWPGGRPLPQDCTQLTPADKTAALVDFTLELAARVRHYRPAIRTARSLYARAVFDPAAEARFSQSLDAFLAAYDHPVLMAMPGLDQVEGDPLPWLLSLVDAVAAQPAGLDKSLDKSLDKTIFQLQARDWREERWLDARTLRAQMHALVRAGAVNLAYYPDDFVRGRPAREPLFQGLSKRSFPYREVR